MAGDPQPRAPQCLLCGAVHSFIDGHCAICETPAPKKVIDVNAEHVPGDDEDEEDDNDSA
jgi:hypothetical protein